jgi:glycogen debranching enzyme
VPITEIRPNFVIALSLPFDFTNIEGLKKGEELARKHLVTPFGLRSLSPQSPMYKERYIGNQKERDRSYHQGTIWTWLLLPYAKLLEKVIQEKDLLKSELEKSIYQLRSGIRNGSLASIAEIWDGKNPNVPKGAPVQAWSVAAVYYIEKMIEEL